MSPRMTPVSCAGCRLGAIARAMLCASCASRVWGIQGVRLDGQALGRNDAQASNAGINRSLWSGVTDDVLH